MNISDITEAEINEQRAWVLDQKAQLDPTTGEPVTWKKLGLSFGIAHQTLQLFATGNYKEGRNDRQAQKIIQHRNTLERKEEALRGRLSEPEFVTMPTATRINSLLAIAHTGQVTLACTGPGTCKTFIAKRYLQTSGNNVWMITMRPAKKRLTPMVSSVLKALGGTMRLSTSWMSDQIVELMTGRKGLLIVDEANHSDFECLDELRAFHDATGVGICLLGNEDLIKTIRSGQHRHTLGRFNSRIDQCHEQDLPLEADIDAYLDAWGIADSTMRRQMVAVGLRPGSGGLREIKKIIQAASLLASGDEQELSGKYLREAQAMRSTNVLRAVA